MRNLCLLFALLALGLIAGCAKNEIPDAGRDADSPDDDSGTPTTDAGRRDSGTPGMDSGTPGEDGGTMTDAGPELEVPTCSACERDSDCEPGICIRVDDGRTLCVPRCDAAADDCPGGLTCEVSGGGVARCVPSDGSTCCADRDGDGFGVGVDCSAEDCDDGDDTIYAGATEICDGLDQDCNGVPDDGALECMMGAAAVPCTTECGLEGMASCTDSCTLTACAAEEVCNGCDDDADGIVEEGFPCVTGELRACTSRCGTTGTQACDSSCAFGGDCTPPAETCDGTDEDCDGVADEDFPCASGGSVDCTTSCGTMGTQTCDASCAPAGACTPPSELCNGADDDCDGTVDEELTCAPGETQPCTTACGTTGLQTCGAMCGFGTCEPPTEECNGIDDNCDGTADEGFECIAGATRDCTTACGSTGVESCGAGCAFGGTCAPPAETCNGLDDDCDSMVDEGFGCQRGATTSCTTSCGTTGSTVCDATCNPGACAPPPEACNGLNDDCDGATDEGFACVAGSSSSCTTSCGSTGTQFCSDACSPSACVAPSETCNGADDDCDGSIDEDFTCAQGSTVSCNTACGSTGTAVCSASCEPGACTPPAEVCNGADDDCDGTPDEDFACAAGATAACTTSCGSAGTQMCSASCMPTGACAPPAEACNGADDDCDTNVDEDFTCAPGGTRSCTTSCGSAGVETCDTSCNFGVCAPPTETCDGTDQDCDGVCDNGFACCAGATGLSCTVGGCTGTRSCDGACMPSACNLGMAPANNVCAGATTLTAGTTVPFQTCGAADTFNSTCGGMGVADVVYRIVLSARSRVRVTTDANFNAVLDLRGPTTTCPGTSVACDDDSGPGTNARIDRQLNSGTYWLIVDGKTATDVGSGNLNVEIDPVPANDLCANATSVPNAGGTFMGTTLGAASERSGTLCGQDGGPDVWYALTIGVRSVVYAYVDGADGADFSVELRAGCTGTTRGCNADSGCGAGNTSDPQLATVVDPGTFVLAVDGPAGQEAPFTLRVIVSPAGSDTPLGQARRITADGTYSAAMLDTTPDSEPPLGCALEVATGQRDLTWFLTMCPSESAPRRFSTCASGDGGGDSIVYVRRNDLLAMGGQCQNNGCGPDNFLSLLDANLDGSPTGGSLWFAVVDEFNFASLSVGGAVEMVVGPVP